MFKKHTIALSIIPLALATVSTVTHAVTPVIGGSANYELQYGGAISNEAPKVYGEIPVETKDLASTLEHHKINAVNDSGNLVMPISEMEGATLLRAHTVVNNANPADVMIRVGGVDIDDIDKDFPISIEAAGDSGQVGHLEFIAFKDASAIGHLTTESVDAQSIYLNPTRAGKEAARDWAVSVSGRTIGQYIERSITGGFEASRWTTDGWPAGTSFTDNELFSLVYSADMELVFPETDYPDQWSAVLDIEMEVL